MSNELVKLDSFEKDVNTLQQVAKMAQSSGLYSGVGSEAKIFMILLAAKELGVPPMMALNGGLWNIQGRIEISARLMASMIRRAGHSFVVKECNNKKCVILGTRVDNNDSFMSEFTIEDASAAGLSNKDVWKKYTQDMLYARALSRLARRLFADIIGSCFVEGEIRQALEPSDSEPQETSVEVIEESPEEKLSIFQDFASEYHEEKSDYIIEFLKKYSEYWKKSAKDTVADYADREKFCSVFMKWKKKEGKEE